jgi:hypothetical protein
LPSSGSISAETAPWIGRVFGSPQLSLDPVLEGPRPERSLFSIPTRVTLEGAVDPEPIDDAGAKLASSSPEFDSKQLKPPRNLAQFLKTGVAGDKM